MQPFTRAPYKQFEQDAICSLKHNPYSLTNSSTLSFPLFSPKTEGIGRNTLQEKKVNILFAIDLILVFQSKSGGGV